MSNSLKFLKKLDNGDVSLRGEEEAYKLINKDRFYRIIADPEFYRILESGGAKLIGLPHIAVSSKLHWNEYPDYLGDDIEKIIVGGLK